MTLYRVNVLTVNENPSDGHTWATATFVQNGKDWQARGVLNAGLCISAQEGERGSLLMKELLVKEGMIMCGEDGLYYLTAHGYQWLLLALI